MACIAHSRFGRIVVNDHQEQRDLILLPDRIVRWLCRS
jgi:hypothetical protein